VINAIQNDPRLRDVETRFMSACSAHRNRDALVAWADH
jgi:hypothetical protein